MQTCCSTIPQYLLCLHKSFAYNMTTPLHAGNHTTHLLAPCISRNDCSPHLSPHPSGDHVQVHCLANCFWDDRRRGTQPSDWPHISKSVELFDFHCQRFWPASGQCHYFWPLLDGVIDYEMHQPCSAFYDHIPDCIHHLAPHSLALRPVDLWSHSRLSIHPCSM